ncbi:hypothetical protein [Gryllotalpicola ginsengisoli]|uniref:hypothetical protein n=1 Tax=Gryllotalpicola ginsengisoli TaxID=444608 RepID=UPI000526E969|nr:hypothetical protein [Gryllotalpicola ginsengisoli]
MSLVERLADTVMGIGVKNVYGEPTELNGVHIVPVALSVHSFGAGEGKGPKDTGEGDGGGGFVASVPIGAYVRDIRGLRFEPNLVSLLAVGIPFVWVTGRVLARLLKIAKK